MDIQNWYSKTGIRKCIEFFQFVFEFFLNFGWVSKNVKELSHSKGSKASDNK